TQGLYLAKAIGNLSNILGWYVDEPPLHAPAVEISHASEYDPSKDDLIQVEFAEGAQIRSERLFFARNRSLRAAAIGKFGVKCTVCGFDFESTYGALGRGYTEVHHLETMASRGATAPGPDGWTTSVDDVRPLCANCHRMAHQVSPPLSIEELKRRIALA